MKDYYQILNTSREASQEDIKRAFRTLAMQYHPDRNPNDPFEADRKFKEINEAYQVLGDEQRRQIYDFTGGTQTQITFGRGWGCGRGRGRGGGGRCRRWQSWGTDV